MSIVKNLKSKIVGWQDVFYFTLRQGIKGNAIKVSVIVMCLLAIISVPVMQFIMSGVVRVDGNSDIADNTTIEKVIILDELGLGMEAWEEAVSDYETFSDIEYEETSDDLDDLEENLQNEEDMQNTLIMYITYENGIFSMEFIKGSDTKIDDTDVENFSIIMKEYFEENKINVIGISQEQADTAKLEVESDIVYLSQGGDGNSEADNHVISIVEYYLILAVIVVLVMFITISGEFVASTIVTEKSNKVIEYLLVNVRPLALIVGKVLAVMVISIGEFVLVGISLFVSNIISLIIFDSNSIGMSENMSLSLNFNFIPISILIMLAGVLLYSIIAGLAGAAVGRIEDMSEGMQLFSIFVIVGAYMGIALVMSSMGKSDLSLFGRFACLFPLSSPFIVPEYLLLERISVGFAFISLLILFVSIALVFLFVSNVFEVMIYYNGNTLKIRDIILISKHKEIVSTSNKFKKKIRFRRDRLNNHISSRNRRDMYRKDGYTQKNSRQRREK